MAEVAMCRWHSPDGLTNFTAPCSMVFPPGWFSEPVPEEDPEEPPPPPPEPPPPPPEPPPLPEWSETGGWPYCYEYTINYLGFKMYRWKPTWLYPGAWNPELPGCENINGPPTPTVPDPPPIEYKIFLPGIQDVIKIPRLESRNLQIERIIRFKQAQTIIPKPLQWIPGVINWLDDCQDILITALYLSKWALIKLPLRFVPYLGWVLLANDIVNLSTGLLSTTMGGRSFKRAGLDALATIAKRRTYKLQRPTEFLTEKIPRMAAILQGGQALETITGYGLQLGSLMGVVSGATFGVMRVAAGEEVTLEGIPKNDILAKATRVALQNWQAPWTNSILNDNERDLIIAANRVANMTLRMYQPARHVISMAPVSEAFYLPKPSKRFNQLVIEALKVKDGDPDLPTTGTAWFHPRGAEALRVGEILDEVTGKMPIWENSQKELYGDTTHGSVMGMAYTQDAIDNVEWALEGPGALEPIYSEVEQDMAAATEYCLMPAGGITPEKGKAWSKRARELSGIHTFKRPTFAQLKQAAEELFNGWTRITPATFRGE